MTIKRDAKLIEYKKNLLNFWQETARDKAAELGEVTRKADSLEKEVYELENQKEEEDEN